MFQAVVWAPQGAFASEPVYLHDNLEEGEEPPVVENIDDAAESDPHDVAHELEIAKIRDDPVLGAAYREFGLEHYDDEDRDVAVTQRLAMPSLYSSNKDDPYITVADADDNEEEQAEQFRLSPTDLILLTARSLGEDLDMSYIDVFVYDMDSSLQTGTKARAAGKAIPQCDGDQFFHHHDISLPYPPLQIEWVGFDVKDATSGPGNYIAVCGFSNGIDLFPLDAMDVVQPAMTLGGERPVTTKRGGRRFVLVPGSHQGDAVLSIAWNRGQRNLLASGGSDKKIKIWDMSQPNHLPLDFSHHKDAVSRLLWHPLQPQILLSVSLDGMLAAVDVAQRKLISHCKLPGSPEDMQWFPLGSDGMGALAVGLSDGSLAVYSLSALQQGQFGTPVVTRIEQSKKRSELSAIAVLDSGSLLVASQSGTMQQVTVSDQGAVHLGPRWSLGRPVYSMRTSPGTPLVAVGCGSGVIEVINVTQHGVTCGQENLAVLPGVHRVYDAEGMCDSDDDVDED